MQTVLKSALIKVSKALDGLIITDHKILYHMGENKYNQVKYLPELIKSMVMKDALTGDEYTAFKEIDILFGYLNIVTIMDGEYDFKEEATANIRNLCRVLDTLI